MKLRLILLLFLVTLPACSWQRPSHSTPLRALTEFPGYLTQEKLNSVSVLREERVAGGVVLLYRYPATQSKTGDGNPATAPTACIATTFVTQERNGSWQAQSASKLGCGPDVGKGFAVTYTVGGNVMELTTVYGVSEAGDRVRIEWADGQSSIVPLVDNVFLQSRPENSPPRRVELLDEEGMTLDSTTWEK